MQTAHTLPAQIWKEPIAEQNYHRTVPSEASSVAARIRKSPEEDTIYENVRVCCQHGKPCRKAHVPEEEQFVELDKVVAQMDKLQQQQQRPPPPRPVEEEDGTYENLDPKAAKKTKTETESTEDSSKKSKKKEKRKDLAKEIYLGQLDWKKAEIQTTGRLALYHPTEDARNSLFLLLKKKTGFRHYRIIQKGMKFSVEDGDANPKEYKTLDEMVTNYKRR